MTDTRIGSKTANELATKLQLKNPLPTLLTADEVADRLRISPNTLANWRVLRRHLRFYKFGDRVLYDAADVIAFLESGRVEAEP